MKNGEMSLIGASVLKDFWKQKRKFENVFLIFLNFNNVWFWLFLTGEILEDVIHVYVVTFSGNSAFSYAFKVINNYFTVTLDEN